MDDVAVQRCRSCGEVKPVDEFDLRADTGRRRSTCSSCRRDYQRARWPWSVNPSRSTRVIGRREMYPCRRCAEMKPAEAFQRRFRGSSVLQSWCRACIAAYNAERHQRLHDTQMVRIRRNQRIYVERNLRLIREYLAEHPCVDCGENDPIVLDFDHIRDKTADVSTLVHNGHPWQRILDEIAKCEVRCANDHRRATHRRRLALTVLEDPGNWSGPRPWDAMDSREAASPTGIEPATPTSVASCSIR